eukprot:9680722-Alexandrium_andersonii.AAC.1
MLPAESDSSARELQGRHQEAQRIPAFTLEGGDVPLAPEGRPAEAVHGGVTLHETDHALPVVAISAGQEGEVHEIWGVGRLVKCLNSFLNDVVS